MSWLDGGLFVILVLFVIDGLTHGLVHQLISLVGIISGLILAWLFYRRLAAELAFAFGSLASLEPLTFALIFLCGWGVASLIGIVAGSRPRDEDRDWVNPLGGALLGFANGVLILATLATVVVQLDYALSRQIQASQIGSRLLRFAHYVNTFLSRYV